MPLRDFLHKKDKLNEQAHESSSRPSSSSSSVQQVIPEFKIIRSDTHGEEVLSIPSQHTEDWPLRSTPEEPATPEKRNRFSILKPRPRGDSSSSLSSPPNATKPERPKHEHRRLSQVLGLKKDQAFSDAVPMDLPNIDKGVEGEDSWEQRATLLASQNERSRSMPSTPTKEIVPVFGYMTLNNSAKRDSSVDSRVSTKEVDDNIQEAIRLHEAGELKLATLMFGRLADPNGSNNALSQVLYGLALRHGWGCTADPNKAIDFLSLAASNAASIEDVALKQGRKQGGAAKGELVLAIFELANSFRHGWGVKKDPVAAMKYYETAANLGDTDAMNEVAWCYLEGFGCKKDKFQSAKYYRLAETGGNKTLGNTWIWKEKYNPYEST